MVTSSFYKCKEECRVRKNFMVQVLILLRSLPSFHCNTRWLLGIPGLFNFPSKYSTLLSIAHQMMPTLVSELLSTNFMLSNQLFPSQAQFYEIKQNQLTSSPAGEIFPFPSHRNSWFPNPSQVYPGPFGMWETNCRQYSRSSFISCAAEWNSLYF